MHTKETATYRLTFADIYSFPAETASRRNSVEGPIGRTTWPGVTGILGYFILARWTFGPSVEDGSLDMNGIRGGAERLEWFAL